MPSAAGPVAAQVKVNETKPGLVRRVVLPPGYDAQAARSTLKRYPKQAAAALRSLAGNAPSGADASAPVWQIGAFEEQLERMHASSLAAMWLGHATVLLRINGQWVLTDPVLSDQIGVRLGVGVAGLTVGPRRLLPAIDPSRLPTPDLILLSHAHFDHLDRPTLRALLNKRTRVVTARGTARLVPRGFGQVQELNWEEELALEGMRLQTLRPNHWGARTMWDRHRGFNSYALRGDRSVLYAGDTAHTDAYSALGNAPIDLSIFGIGAYDPWIAAHANPEQVWHMHRATGASRLLPMHHSTFVLSDEPLHEPLQRLYQAAGPDAEHIVGTRLGEAWIWDTSASEPFGLGKESKSSNRYEPGNGP